MNHADLYGFQPPETAQPQPVRTTWQPFEFNADTVREVAAGRQPLPEGFWGSYDHNMILFREAVRAIWAEEEKAEQRRSSIESAAYSVVQDARSGRYGSVEVFVKHDSRGQPYATHVRFKHSIEPMTIEAAYDAKLIR